MTAPGAPRSSRSRWTPKRWNSVPCDACRGRRGGPRRRAACARPSSVGVRAPVDGADLLGHERARPAGDRAAGHGRVPRRRRRSARPPPRSPRSRRGGPRGDRGCSSRPAAWGTCGWPRPRRRRTRHRPRARSRPTPRRRARSPNPATKGPRSPRGPGCTTRQRCVDQMDSGMSFLRIGQTIRSGRWAATAASICRPRLDHRDLDVVPELGERDPAALAEAVVGGDEEEDVESVACSRRTRGGARLIQ